MADKIDEQLVQRIVEHVLEVVLKERGQSAPRPGTGASARVRPPAGVCTGDYSKFTELAGRGVGAVPGAQHEAPEPGPHSPIALTGIVTAQQLREAIDSAPDGVARLAHEARLTPLANDFARQHPEKVRRVGRASVATEPANPASTDAAPWLWWADGHCPNVQALTGQLGARLRPSATPRSEGSLAQVVADLAGAVQGGNVAGGLLFVRSAARAVCFANRCRALRAAVGTCPESVEQAISELGANVLIVEYPHVNAQAMEAMVRRVVQSSPKPPADVQRHLNELQGGR